MNLKEMNPFIKEITKHTSQIIKQYYRKEIVVDYKADHSPVTIADKKVEEYIVQRITKKFPDHKILGEESGMINAGSSSKYEWVIDPIDGTKSFIHGVPLFGTLLALLENNEPIFGVYHNPILDDLLIGDNFICLYNDQPVTVRDCKDLSDALILTTDHFLIGEYHQQTTFDHLVKQCKLYRTWADAYGYFLLAAGYADIMLDPIMSKWDLMALIPIIRGAGGMITDYHGNNPALGNSIVAAAPKIHKKVIEMLK